MTGNEKENSNETDKELPPVKVVSPLKTGKLISKNRSNKKHAPQSERIEINQQPLPDGKKHGNKEQTTDNHEPPDTKNSGNKEQTTGNSDSTESDDEDLETLEDENKPEVISAMETQLKTLKFDEVKDKLGRENMNDKTLKSYISAYNTFLGKVTTLPSGRNGKVDDTLDRYINEQYDEKKKVVNLAKMTHLICMIKIIYPQIYVSILNAKTTLKNRKKN